MMCQPFVQRFLKYGSCHFGSLTDYLFKFYCDLSQGTVRENCRTEQQTVSPGLTLEQRF